MPFFAQTFEVILGLIGPWVFMWNTVTWIPYTIKKLMKERQIGVLFSPSSFKDAWFGNFWSWAGPEIKINVSPKILPLLEGRVTDAKIGDEPTGAGLAGVCIEIGAGSGFWVDIFSDMHLGKGNRGKVTRVYGVEPNRDQHVSLRSKIAEAGLEDVYEIVPVGIEDLNNPLKWGGKVEKESVDCIVSILCLCSIPEPQKNLKELYSYLKPGGRWYIYEHIRVDQPSWLRAYQAFVNLFWPQCLGGCQLCRPTAHWLKEAGPWTQIDVGKPDGEPWYQVVPHAIGVFTK